jgi:hypothetical protein
MVCHIFWPKAKRSKATHGKRPQEQEPRKLSVISLKYTARDGGDALRAVAKQAAVLPGPTKQVYVSTNSSAFPKQNNQARFFSLRHEFPTQWYKFLHPLATDAAQTMLLALSKERFPFQYRARI